MALASSADVLPTVWKDAGVLDRQAADSLQHIESARASRPGTAATVTFHRIMPNPPESPTRTHQGIEIHEGRSLNSP